MPAVRAPSGRFGHRSLPHRLQPRGHDPGQQLVDPVDWMLGDALQDVAQVPARGACDPMSDRSATGRRCRGEVPSVKAGSAAGSWPPSRPDSSATGEASTSGSRRRPPAAGRPAFGHRVGRGVLSDIETDRDARLSQGLRAPGAHEFAPQRASQARKDTSHTRRLPGGGVDRRPTDFGQAGSQSHCWTCEQSVAHGTRVDMCRRRASQGA